MISKEGFNGLIQRSSPNLPKSQPTSPSGFIVGRVVDIILDENHPKFKELGEYSSIGTVIYENVGNSNLGTSTKIASPLFSNNKTYPLIGELILLTQSPSPIQSSNDFTPSIYYISGINLWNSPHHNLLPNPLKPNQDVINTSSNPSQPQFIEKDNIYPLLSFTGDVVYEGRNGQSLRFGSTTKSNSLHKNTWSSVGNNGDPITILRNGQNPEIIQSGWIPITEDINNDLSIICLTSTQKLEYDDIIINKFNKFYTLGRSITLNNFTQPQILFNSNRITINAKEDSIFIGAKEHINFSTEGYTNFKSQNLYIDAKNVKLGDETATESLILGDSFMDNFNFLLKALNNLCTVLETDTSWPGGVPAPNTPVNVAASALKSQVENISNKINLGKFTSKISKTI
jgi:hypothetical protein